MKYFVEEKQLVDYDSKTAGGKAREDIGDILTKAGYKKLIAEAESDERKDLNVFERLEHHIVVKNIWETMLQKVRDGDEIIIQFPIFNHTIFFNKVIKSVINHGGKVILLIHDLESLRWSKLSSIPLKTRIRLSLEEKSILRFATGIIAHNARMKEYLLDYGIDNQKIVSLNIFDYLIPSFKHKNHPEKIQLSYPIIIAGNLREHKAGYVYHLPSNVNFNLYGIGYKETDENNVNYHGSFMPDDLPFEMVGSFGLVWDGPSGKSCEGVYGEYLRVNNPHKTSLYLASGIPVVIWSEAALANFICENQCGFVVSSLEELNHIIKDLSDEDYQKMKLNAQFIGGRLREGYYTNEALSAFK